MQPKPTSLLDVPISAFANLYATEPLKQTTLRRFVTTGYYRDQIQAIRAEPDETKQKDLKKYLPAITPAALLHHRKKDTGFADKISHQWPMLMCDIDKQDNRGLDMARLKEALVTSLDFILLCAYSVRGGLWFVVRLPEAQTPETLAAHYRHLERVFSKRFEITLDSSKGGNPTDLRLVSYDPAPYLNDEATVMYKTYTPPTPNPTCQNTGTRRPVDYSRFRGRDEGQLLTRLVRFAEAATEGNRHTTLLKAAKLAGGYVAARRMDEQTAVCALETVASEWPTFSKSQKTIRDGIRYGLAKPIYADEAPPKPPAPPKPAPLIVRTLAEWVARPGSVCKPDESQLERIQVEACDPYPAEWDAPNPPDAVPKIKLIHLHQSTLDRWHKE